MGEVLEFKNRMRKSPMSQFVFDKAMEAMFLFGYSHGIRKGLLVGALIGVVIFFGLILVFSVRLS